MTLKSQDLLVVLKIAAYGIRSHRSKTRITEVTDTESKRGWTDTEDFQKTLPLGVSIEEDHIQEKYESTLFFESDIDHSLIKESIISDNWTYRQMAEDLYISTSEASAATQRAIKSKLIRISSESEKPEPIRGNLEEFIIHATKYIFPPERGSETRGIPTAYASPLFEKLIVQSNDLPPVWADPYGTMRGISISPIYKTVPKAVKKDVDLYELLSIVDTFRLGRPREIEIATYKLLERLNKL